MLNCSDLHIWLTYLNIWLLRSDLHIWSIDWNPTMHSRPYRNKRNLLLDTNCSFILADIICTIKGAKLLASLDIYKYLIKLCFGIKGKFQQLSSCSEQLSVHIHTAAVLLNKCTHTHSSCATDKTLDQASKINNDGPVELIMSRRCNY